MCIRDSGRGAKIFSCQDKTKGLYETESLLDKKAVTAWVCSRHPESRKWFTRRDPESSRGFKAAQVAKTENINVGFVSHTALNTTKGVVICRDLLKCTEEEIVMKVAP